MKYSLQHGNDGTDCALVLYSIFIGMFLKRLFSNSLQFPKHMDFNLQSQMAAAVASDSFKKYAQSVSDERWNQS